MIKCSKESILRFITLCNVASTLNLMVGGSTPLWRTKMIERVRTYNSYSLLINSILLCTNNNRKELEDGDI